ncbi:MAG TPA: ribosome biogenesis GTPase Der [Burkholderiales bacterium]|nr:ribosome biogenesis GTPase Der [Burkholderiales bacterium]
MLPTLVIVGRPNVGKSTLFNRLTRSRDAIVADLPGLTRDRQYGHGRVGDVPFLVIDTGGFEPDAQSGLPFAMARQTVQAMDEADTIVFVVDARAGLTPADRIIAEQLRRSSRRVLVAANKAEGLGRDTACAEFHELGLGDPVALSAAHGEGVGALVEDALAGVSLPAEPLADESAPRHPRVAVVGRPNVGKSTLVNALLGEERVIASDEPGTTRDAIRVEFECDGRRFTLIDTAGLRRRGRVAGVAEKFSVVKTLQAVEEANVVILVLDAQEGVGEQDAHIGGFVVEAGRALVVVVNKWDGLAPAQREQVKRDLERKLGFLAFARWHFVSALRGTGLSGVLASAHAAYAAAMTRLPTPRLTRVLQAAVTQQPPPRAGLVRPKLRYAHQGGNNPPVIVIHGNAVDHVPASYRRYLERCFREAFELDGTPLRVELRKGTNPFGNRAGRH